jgi:hypothetical protein
VLEKGGGLFEGHNLLEDVLSRETSEVSGFEAGSFHRDLDFKSRMPSPFVPDGQARSTSMPVFNMCLILVDIISNECSFKRF